MQLAERVLDTYSWYQSVGNEVEETALARYVSNRECPDVWVANHLSRVRAESPAEVDRVLQRSDRVFAHCSHRMALVDALTPDAFIARLILEGFDELTPTLQMVLEGALAPAKAGERTDAPPPSWRLQSVASEEDWESLYRLVRANHIEGDSSHHLELEEAITRRIVAGYRSKSGVAQFFLAWQEGAACAYGSAVVGPHGIGIVEDLFTLPAFRGRGLATAILARAVEHARARGMGAVIIGPHAPEKPKALYASLGFTPLCVTRQYLRA